MARELAAVICAWWTLEGRQRPGEAHRGEQSLTSAGVTGCWHVEAGGRLIRSLGTRFLFLVGWAGSRSNKKRSWQHGPGSDLSGLMATEVVVWLLAWLLQGSGSEFSCCTWSGYCPFVYSISQNEVPFLGLGKCVISQHNWLSVLIMSFMNEMWHISFWLRCGPRPKCECVQDWLRSNFRAENVWKGDRCVQFSCVTLLFQTAYCRGANVNKSQIGHSLILK